MRARVLSECALEIPSTGPIDEEAAEAAPVVAMHLDGSLPPLYLIRTWADEIFKQRRLAQHLGPQQPIYSIAPPGGTRKSDYPDTVDAWAELCLQRLSPVLRGEPYVLGGWSFGGVIALELAEKLMARGEKVRLITMLDTRLPARHPYTTKGKRKVTKLHKFSKHLSQYVELPSRRERGAFLRKRIRRRFEKWGKKLEKLGTRARRAPPPKEIQVAPDGQSFVKPGGKKVPYLMRAISVSYLKYRATESTIPIAQYWCADSRAAVGDASLGWAKIHSGEFESVRVPGSHWTLFNEPHVATLADRLARSLRRAREEP